MPAHTSSPRHAHRFSADCLRDAAHLRHMVRLLDATGEARLVVAAPLQGADAALTALMQRAAAGADWRPDWQALCRRHLEAAGALDPTDAQGSAAWFDAAFAALAGLLDAPDSAGYADRVRATGPAWSARLLQLALGGAPAGWHLLDAADILHVVDGTAGWEVDAARTRSAFAAQAPTGARWVVPGGVARDGRGDVVVLGVGGEDLSAAMFALLAEATELILWTDVDGIFSADPALVPEAFALPVLSYAEAAELAHVGERILHPQRLLPAMQADLPIHIRNAFNAIAPGTRLLRAPQDAADMPVRGLALIPGMAMLDVAGAGLQGVPGMAARFFAALDRAGVSVSMTSEGSSEHAMCSVIPAEQGERAREEVLAAFAPAIAAGTVEGVTLTPDIAILAAVGDAMVGTPGVAARLFQGLAQARVNARAIAQDAGERNISVAIDAADATRALRAAHAAFWLSPATVSIGLIGPGNVGRALLRQLARTLPQLAADPRSKRRLDLRLRAIANSRRMLLAARQLAPDKAADALADGEPFDMARFVAHVRAEHLPHAMIVDCSGSDAIASHYPEWLAAGIHVVTPAKHAGSGDLARYRAIRAAERHGGQFRYEATVGAGLPVIQTLRGLLDTGDALTAIEGVLSGTLAWLFHRYDGRVPFSQLVLEARALGYTEPDPRDDLSGTDVARKLVILARESGRELSLDDVVIESLVPEHLQTLDRETFLARIDEMDAPMSARLQAAQAQGRGLRYLATLDRDGRARVSLSMPEPGHATLHSRGTDNLIQFSTLRYDDNPLVVQGPGAGADVTAAGVFADMLAIARTLGGHA